MLKIDYYLLLDIPSTDKMTSHPNKLFKYCPMHLLDDAFDNCLVAYSPIGSFNDLFEGRPRVTGINSLDEKVEHIRTDGYKFPATDELSEIFLSIPTDSRPLITYNEIMLMARFRRDCPLDPHASLTEMGGHLAIEFITRSIDKKIGVLSLSEVPDNLLMWAHYGNQHSGFVIEFDAHNPYFHGQDSANGFNQLQRVVYRDTRPSIFLKGATANDLYLTKSSHWSYECEWRILKSYESCHVLKEEKDKLIRLFKYPSDAIKRLILGARTSKSDYLKASAIISSNPLLQHVKLSRAIADPNHFHLEIVDAIEGDFDLKLC